MMEPQAREPDITRLVVQLVLILVAVVGLALIIISYLVAPHLATTLRPLGLSLLPAGVVSLLASRFAGVVTEVLVRRAIVEAITDTVRRELGERLALVRSCVKLGLDSAFLTRAEALKRSARFLDAEVRKGAAGRVWIVASSLNGVLNCAVEGFNGRRIMHRVVQSGCDLRVLMTRPDMADARAAQEHRGPGEIPEEIRGNLAYLKRVGARRESVKWYPGAPTVFAIASSDRMLLNPYPYETDAFACFSILVGKTLDPDADIYHQYLEYHFEAPWRRGQEIPVTEWDSLR